MMKFILPLLLAAVLAGCSEEPDEAASAAVVERFHVALNAGDTQTIHSLLSESTRKLRPGIGTARAFRNVSARHGRYLGGELAIMSKDHGRTRLDWRARFVNGPVLEQFMLVREAGAVKIDGYSDNAAS